MSVQLGILILFIVLLILSVMNILPITWWAVCIAYLATVQAIGTLLSVRFK